MPGAVDPNEEERQPPRAHALQRRQPVRDLLEPGTEAALEQLDIVSRRLARAQEAGVRHHHSGSEIAGEVAAIESLGSTIGKARALDQPVDFAARLDLGELIGNGERARRRVEDFRHLQLPRVEIGTAQQVGHHVDRQHADRQLMLDAQSLSDRAVEIAGSQPQLVGEFLRDRVEIRKIAAPAFDLAAYLADRIERAGRGRAARADPVEGTRKGFGAAGCAGEPFLEFVAVDLEIGEHRIGKPPPERGLAPARLACRERARIEVETLGELDDQRSRQRALVLLDEVEIARRNRQHLGHRRLGQPRLAPQAADGVASEEFAIGHDTSSDLLGAPAESRAYMTLTVTSLQDHASLRQDWSRLYRYRSRIPLAVGTQSLLVAPRLVSRLVKSATV